MIATPTIVAPRGCSGAGGPLIIASLCGCCLVIMVVDCGGGGWMGHHHAGSEVVLGCGCRVSLVE